MSDETETGAENCIEKMVIRLPAELKTRLETDARDDGRTLTAHVVLLLAKACKMPNIRPLVRGGRRHAVVANGATR